MTEADDRGLISGRRFLDHAYDLPDRRATAAFYGGWAASYDAEITGNGYATPARCAAALAAYAADLSAPVLDIGCGTGLSGLALTAAGFGTIDGTDLSAEMLVRAEARGVYRRLFRGDLADPLPVAPGVYANAAAVGVVSPGHAPPETVDAVLAILPPGGCLVLSLNDHALADPAFPGRIEQLVAAGAAEPVFREHGPHLPGIGLEATVLVLRKP
jgi:predicted TPR repeat methyltransferase